MNDQELIRKAVQEAAEEHDLEKVGKLLSTALKYGGKVASKITPFKGTASKIKEGFKGTAPTGKAAPGTTKTTYGSPRMQAKHGPVQPSTAQKVGQTAQSATQIPGKVASTLKTAPTKIKNIPAAIAANPAKTAKVVVGTAGAGGAIAAGITAKDALSSPTSKPPGSGSSGPGGAGGGGIHEGGTGPGGAKPITQQQSSSRFMGRTGKSGHAGQMIQGYKPPQDIPKTQRAGQTTTATSMRGSFNPIKMLKEFVDNSTAPQMAQSMPTTAAEMPMAVLNDSYQELMGSNLPPVKLKVDDQDPDVAKVTEAVMKQQEDQWQSAQQIGAQVIDAMMYNPSMIPGGGKVKGLYDKLRGKVSPDAIKDMKFDESGMPMHPKTGKPMDEKQMTQFYGDVMGSKHAGTQGFGQQVMNQPPQNIPPQKEPNVKPV